MAKVIILGWLGLQEVVAQNVATYPSPEKLVMLLQPLIVVFRCGWRNPGDRKGELSLGLGMSLLIVCIHSYCEWIFITFPRQYMLALDAGMVDLPSYYQQPLAE